MATATAERPAPLLAEDEVSLMEKLMKLPVSAKVEQMNAAMEAREEDIEDLLPDFMKGQGARLIKRARLTFGKSASLQACTPASFIKCVLEAAELGFAIDGRLCHAVAYENSKKVGKDERGKDKWIKVKEATLQVDYKGLIAVAKRSKLVHDVWSRLVHENDNFVYEEENAVTHYSLKFDPKKPRGQVVGVLSVATHDHGYRTDYMHIDEVNAIRDRSKSYKYGDSSPWHTDPGEMQKKTGSKRLLKTFTDDPGLCRAMEIDSGDYDDADESLPTKPQRTVADAANDLKRRMAPTAQTQNVTDSAEDELPDTSYEPPAEQEASQETPNPLTGFIELVEGIADRPKLAALRDDVEVSPEYEGRRAEFLAVISAHDDKLRADKGRPKKGELL